MKNIALFLSIALNLLLIAGVLYLVHSLGGFSYMYFKMKNRGATGIYEVRKNVFEAMPKDTGAIVFVGNSITQTCEWSELLDRPIKNRGISGETTDGLLARLGAITKMEPARLFLMTGVNDLIFVGPQQVLTNYRKILTQIKTESPHTELILQSVLPVNNEIRANRIKNSDILKVNQGIEQMAKEMDLSYINLHPLLCDDKGRLAAKFTFDGIHINGEAYLLWKNEIIDYLDEGLE